MENRVPQNDDSLEDIFDRASKHLPSLIPSLSAEELLCFYGRYKQATEGECNISRPAIWNQTARRKWDAWHSMRGVSKRQAMQEYVASLQKHDPDWAADDSACVGWVRVSRFAPPPPTPLHDSDTPFLDAVRGGEVDAILEMPSLKQLVREVFAEGMTGLHWAADRGHCGVAKVLLEHGASVNAQDDAGQTPLHFAATCCHNDLVALLLQHDADVSVTDEDGLTAKEVTDDQELAKLMSC